MSGKGYKNLIVWKKSDELAFQTYWVSKNFPREERFGLTSQLRRAVVSIPTNIAEGAGRQHRNETKQFVNIALGSLAETEYLIDFCKRLNFFSLEEHERLSNLRNEVGALLWLFYKSF